MLSKHGIEDFSITRAAKLDYAAIVAYVAEGQAELCEFPVGGLPRSSKVYAHGPPNRVEAGLHTRRRVREGDRW